MRLNSACIPCLIMKEEKAIRHIQDEERKSNYLHEILKILYDYGLSYPAPWLTAQIAEKQEEYFGVLKDYSTIKHHFNQLLLAEEAVLEERILQAEDPLAECIRYVCAGNYIDFGIPQGVHESILEKMIEKASTQSIDPEELAHLKEDLSQARELVYLTDNCGEIVLDKIFIRTLKSYYPDLHVTVCLRGIPVINDATLEDAEEIGLTAMVDCIGNGSGVAGTMMAEISEEARGVITSADLIISKGMGNFETLYGEGLNPYYFFLCKCDNFVQKFNMELYATIFSREERIKVVESAIVS